MVGRLVEHDQVRVADQRGGQRDPPLLAAGQPVHRAVEVTDAEPVQHVAHPGVGRPLVVRGAVPGGQHHVPDPGAGGQRVALGQVGQPQPAEPADPAAVRGARRR